eukprot:676570-Alexandrium_andersonii.AAC.1
MRKLRRHNNCRPKTTKAIFPTENWRPNWSSASVDPIGDLGAADGEVLGESAIGVLQAAELPEDRPGGDLLR